MPPGFFHSLNYLKSEFPRWHSNWNKLAFKLVILMKLFLAILACLLLVFSVTAQPLLDENREPIPFALSKKYNKLIDLTKIKTCVLKCYNNDSLYIKYNKDFNSVSGNENIGGFPIDTVLNLKAKATKYKINEGTLWLYRIESNTAEMLYAEIEKFVIPEGGHICFFPKQSKLNLKGPRFFYKKDTASLTSIHGYQYGNQLYIEYFEPNGSKNATSIIINKIGYGFAVGSRNILKPKKAPPSMTGKIML